MTHPIHEPPQKEVLCEVTKAVQRFHPTKRDLCLACKGGRLLCGRPACPLLKRISIQAPMEGKFKEHLFGPSPSVFIGWKGYPNVYAGPLTALEEEPSPALLDDPGRWYGSSLEEIIGMRSRLVRSRVRRGVFDRGRFVEELQELALSIRPTDTEVTFERRPTFGLSFSPMSQPLGPTAPLKRMEIAENPKIPRQVDRVVTDELKAEEAAFQLYVRGHDVYYLTRILSSGTLGEGERRKLVPTRWSITAVDDLLGKRLLREVQEYPLLEEVRLYSNTYLDNHFEVLLTPRKWEFELFEAWAPETLWTRGNRTYAINRETEGYHGRTAYAASEGGGYYAARLAVLEGLSRMESQAGAVVFREIYEGYIVPVGVWEVRENVRKALAGEARRFGSLGEALAEVSGRLKVPLEEYMKRSLLLRQRRLEEFG
jgi:hypothetical protein